MKDNVEDFKKIINTLKESVFKGIQNGLHFTNKEIKSEIIEGSKTAKTGRLYKIRMKSGRYKVGRHSSPQETSGRITGEKNRAIRHSVRGLKTFIGANKDVPHALYVEKGTKNITAREDTKKAGRKISKKSLKNNIQNAVQAKIEENLGNVFS